MLSLMRARAISAIAIAAILSHSTLAFSAPPKAPPAAAAPAPAGPADVETAEQLYAKLDYEQANAIADRVVKQRGLTHDQLVRAYKILAVTYAVTDKEEQAREAFTQLLAYEPDYQVDANLGPRVSAPYSEAKGFWRARGQKPGVDAQVVARAREAGVLRVTTRDPTKVVKKVNVGFRWGSAGDYTVKAVTPGEGVTVELPAPPPSTTRLDYYVQGLDERDSVAMELGSPRVPKTSFAEDRPVVVGASGSGKSVFSSPVFWGVVGGAVLIGGGVAGFLLLRPADPATQASVSPTFRCGADPCK